jgi:hypothetical protein
VQPKAVNLWPFLATVLVLGLVVALVWSFSARQNQGHLIYALDDPYIHMAIAKNLSQHGVWGVTPYEFTSTSSSLLWTLLLSSVYLIFGVGELSPLWMNIFFATLLLWVVFRLLKQSAIKPLYIFLILLGIVLMTPLPVLIFTGMEHVLHALLTILFLYFAARALSVEATEKSSSRILLFLAPLLVMTRYEGLFLVFVACALFLFKRRIGFAFLLGGLALLPMAIFGLVSVRHGWYWLPNTLLLKGNVPDFASIQGLLRFAFEGLKQLLTTKRVLLLFLLSAYLFILRIRRRKPVWEFGQMLLLLFLGSALLHMMLARVGWFYRYEAYLISAGLFVAALAVWDYLPKFRGIFTRESRLTAALPAFGVAILIYLFLGFAGLRAISEIPLATKNIFEQQYQMGLFLKKYYTGMFQQQVILGASVALDDIGAAAYMTGLPCLDLVGLGSLDVLKVKRAKAFNTAGIDSLVRAHQAKIAVLHEQNYLRFYGGLPPQWYKVGDWTIQNNIVCGGATLSFYAMDSTEANRLEIHLKEFSERLPKDVAQEGKYLDSP